MTPEFDAWIRKERAAACADVASQFRAQGCDGEIADAMARLYVDIYERAAEFIVLNGRAPESYEDLWPPTRDYMRSRAWYRQQSDETLFKLHPLKKYCRHVWSYGMWTSKWICDKCGGYSREHPPKRGTYG